MKKIAYDLETGKGYNILQCVYCEENTIPTDEELASMIKYQNAYNLASRMIQTMTEIYDRLILQTGV